MNQSIHRIRLNFFASRRNSGYMVEVLVPALSVFLDFKFRKHKICMYVMASNELDSSITEKWVLRAVCPNEEIKGDPGTYLGTILDEDEDEKLIFRLA